ncbi:MAG: D-glutamate cyclase family protein [Betaproteobacteria bacterium]
MKTEPAPEAAQQARLAIREGRHTGSSRGLAMGHVQCNLVILARQFAFEFLLYCQRNPRACPVLEVTDPGSPEPRRLAPGADLRTDLARYAVWQDGQRQEDRTDITALWRDDLVAFLIGSGITFDQALERAGVPTDRDRWVLNTTLPTEPAGRFSGPLVVTMRWLTPEQAIIATQVSARFPFNHGAPIHIGDPAAIGADLARPLFGPPIERIPADRIAVFWACGVTPQAAAEHAGLDLMITHAPAHSFVTDLLADRFCQP